VNIHVNGFNFEREQDLRELVVPLQQAIHAILIEDFDTTAERLTGMVGVIGSIARHMSPAKVHVLGGFIRDYGDKMVKTAWCGIEPS
jgi:hypothetical protein